MHFEAAHSCQRRTAVEFRMVPCSLSIASTCHLIWVHYAWTEHLSPVLLQGAGMQTAAGTPLYAAPEVLDIYNQMRRGQNQVQPFHSSCDVWSAGWILFEMLFGCKPIDPRGLSEDQFIDKVRNLDLTWPQDGVNFLQAP